MRDSALNPATRLDQQGLRRDTGYAHCAKVKNLLVGNLLSSLGDSAPGGLDALLSVILGRLPLPLNGGAEGLGARGIVASDVGARREESSVLRKILVKLGLEVSLFQMFVASQRVSLLSRSPCVVARATNLPPPIVKE